jgi:hypothetical protein
VYPNPATDEIFIDPNAQGRVIIIDLTGRIILQSDSSDHFDVKSLSKGIYFVRVEVGGKLIIRSFAKL